MVQVMISLSTKANDRKRLLRLAAKHDAKTFFDGFSLSDLLMTVRNTFTGQERIIKDLTDEVVELWGTPKAESIIRRSGEVIKTPFDYFTKITLKDYTRA